MQTEQTQYPLEFRGSKFLSFIPLIIFAFSCVLFFVILKAFDMENLAMGGFVALIIGCFFSKNWGKYWEAVIKGMSSDMCATLALILLVVGMFAKMMAVGGVANGFVWLGSSIGIHGAAFTVFTFIATCLIATATGTSIGTLFSCFPIFYPSGILLGADPLFLAGAILSGAIFGDNMGPISDSTIASAVTQKYITKNESADIAGVVASRFPYAIIAAAIACVLFGIFGGGSGTGVATADVLAEYSRPMGLVMLIPVVVLLIIAFIKRNIFIAITWGIIVGTVVGLIFNIITPAQIFSVDGGSVQGFLIDGIKGMLGLIGYLLALFGIMGVLQESGTMNAIVDKLSNSSFTKSVAGTEFAMGFGTMITSFMLGAANGPAIVMFGPVANDLGRAKGLHPYRRANMMDSFTMTLPVILPFTSAFIFIVIYCIESLATEYAFIQQQNPFAVGAAAFHCWLLFIVLSVAVITGLHRRYEGKDGSQVKDPAQACNVHEDAWELKK